MDHNATFAPTGGIQLLSFDEIDEVTGGTAAEAGLAIGVVAAIVAFSGVILGAAGATVVVVGAYEGAAIAFGLAGAAVGGATEDRRTGGRVPDKK